MSSRFEHLAKSLSATYRLKSALGAGGAAHVFVADELETGRTVAIKVLREELAATVSAKRFLREINIAAQLEHPNIVPVYGSGTVDGLPYYAVGEVRHFKAIPIATQTPHAAAMGGMSRDMRDSSMTQRHKVLHHFAGRGAFVQCGADPFPIILWRNARPRNTPVAQQIQQRGMIANGRGQ